jgi:hypothetical protein
LAYFAVLVCARWCHCVLWCLGVAWCGAWPGVARAKLISVVIVCHQPPDKGGAVAR